MEQLIKSLVILSNVLLLLMLTCGSDLDDSEQSQCTKNEHCPIYFACINGICEDPCPAMCGDNAYCRVRNHIPWCNCKDLSEDESCVICHKRKKTFHIFIDEQVNWYQALANCFSRRTRLATIQDQQEYDDLVRILSNTVQREGLSLKKFWLSGADLAKTGSYLWMSTGSPMSFSRWWWFEPNHLQHCDAKDQEEHCVEISGVFNYMMNDFCCYMPQWYVCEEV